MEVITDSISFKGQRPVRKVRVGGTHGDIYALFCYDNKVILTDKHNFDKIYMVCDAELFVRMVGLKFISKEPTGQRRFRKEQIK